MQYKSRKEIAIPGIQVHPRVHERHPELYEEDVIHAWENAIISAPRLEKNPNEYIALGFDQAGRLIEMAAVRFDRGDWVIFHATTPPSDKTYRELRLER